MRFYYFEVSVGPKDEKARWVRKGERQKTFIECQADAIANGERPYRIKTEEIDEATLPEVQTFEAPN